MLAQATAEAEQIREQARARGPRRGPRAGHAGRASRDLRGGRARSARRSQGVESLRADDGRGGRTRRDRARAWSSPERSSRARCRRGRSWSSRWCRGRCGGSATGAGSPCSSTPRISRRSGRRSASLTSAGQSGIEPCDLQSDERVRVGGAIVRTAEGEVDASVQTQLERAREVVVARAEPRGIRGESARVSDGASPGALLQRAPRRSARPISPDVTASSAT